MAKLVENTFRQVNIALVNELAIMAREMGVDIWEALQAASTKPFGYMPFWPGPGVGGHCISIDPSYLSWRAGQQLGYRIGFIEHANEVNNRMPEYVVSRIGEALNEAGKPLKGSRVFCIGVAYKPGVDDLRESPALEVLDRLARRGATVSYHDPLVAHVELRELQLDSRRAHGGGPGGPGLRGRPHRPPGARRPHGRQVRGARVRRPGGHRRHGRAERRPPVAAEPPPQTPVGRRRSQRPLEEHGPSCALLQRRVADR